MTLADALVVIGGPKILYRFCLIAFAYIASCIFLFWRAS